MKPNPLTMYIVGNTAIILSGALIIPAALAAVYTEKTFPAFVATFALAFAVGKFLREKGKMHRARVNMREAAQIILALWLFGAAIGMLPALLSGKLDPASAFFLAVSYLSTTGIDLLPADAGYSLHVWHVLLSWLGALNYLIIFVTLLPQAAGVFGVNLAFRRSYDFSPMLGQMKNMAKQIAAVFSTFTAAAIFCYYLAGLAPYEAVMAALLTVSTTGGEGTDFLSVAVNPWIKTVAVVFMLIAGGNMLRLFRTVRRREFSDLYRHSESKFFFVTILVVSLIVAVQLVMYGDMGIFSALHLALFETLSFLTTSCFAAADINTWPDMAKICLLLLMFVGGAMGSPTGGIKMMRIIVLVKMLIIEMRRTLHPRMAANVIVDGRSVDFTAASRILAFFFLYLATFFLFALLLSVGSNQSLTATVAMSAACFTHGGFGLGLYDEGAFAALSPYGKTICGLFMIVARMEIFSVLIIIQDVFFERRDKW